MAQVVPVYLTNRTAIVTASGELYDTLRNGWSYSVPGARFSKLFNQRTWDKDGNLVRAWDGKKHFLSRNRISAGLFRATYKDVAQSCDVKFKITRDCFAPDLCVGFEAKEKNRVYQNQCVDSMCAAILHGGGIVLVATGAGKTKIAAQFFARIPRTQHCLFIVDQLDLLYQGQRELQEWLKTSVGVVGEGTFDPEWCTVATIQTLHLHMKDRKFNKWLSKVAYVVVDELHEQLNHRNVDVLKKLDPLAVFGLTATLETKKKEVRMKAYALAGPVIYEFPVAQGIKSGVLEQPHILQLRFPLVDDRNIDSPEQEYRAQVVGNHTKLTATKFITRRLMKRDRRMFILVERLWHMRDLSNTLREFKHRKVYGAVSTDKRQEAIRRFESGHLKLLIANKVFRKGINSRRVDTILDLAELKSKTGAMQKLGRVLRIHDQKSSVLYIDFGTQEGRYLKAAKRRASAFRQANLTVKVVKVETARDAAQTVERFLSG